MSDPLSLLLALVMAAALGGLVGLEREMRLQSENRTSSMAGLRTFAMLGILGFLGMYFFQQFQQFWFIPLFFLGALSFALISHGFLMRIEQGVGITSELAGLGSFAAGMLVAADQLFLALSVSILFTALLALKNSLHTFAQKLSAPELLALLKFLIISFVILKVVPPTWVDPWGFFDWRPQLIWLMVVLVTAIRFIGYFLAKFIGSTRSIFLSGLIGGLSSTAATTSLAQESKGQKKVLPFLSAILLATGVMFLRVLFEAALFSPALMRALLIPLLGMAVIAFGIVLWIIFAARNDQKMPTGEITISRPFDLTSALLFGAFFLMVLLLADKLPQAEFLGDFGLFATGAIAGLTDVDAIILAMAKSVQSGGIEVSIAAGVTFLAVAVNTLIKIFIVFFFASRALWTRFSAAIVAIIAGGGALFWFLHG